MHFHFLTGKRNQKEPSWKATFIRAACARSLAADACRSRRGDLSEKLKLSPMAKAGDQYEVRTGNIWSHCRRDDVRAVTRLLNEGVDLELRNKVPLSPLTAAHSCRYTLTAAHNYRCSPIVAAHSHRCSLSPLLTHRRCSRSPLLTLVEYRPSH